MLEYHYPLFRPPAEANSLIIQATLGCSHNACSFCSMYKTKNFHIKSLKELETEIETFALLYPHTQRVFLADGDAMSLETSHLLEICILLDKYFSKLRRISIYASADNILKKDISQLKELKEHKLNLIYYGIESGNNTLLKKINKGVNSDEIISSLNMASEAGLKISATVILGLGGDEFSKEHIIDTAKLINQVKVTYLSTLQLGLEKDIKERFLKTFESFTPLNDMGILDEQYRFISEINPSNKVIFRSNHASNALPLAGTLPKDKEKLKEQIRYALEDEDILVPKRFRGF